MFHLHVYLSGEYMCFMIPPKKSSGSTPFKEEITQVLGLLLCTMESEGNYNHQIERNASANNVQHHRSNTHRNGR